jgi:HSP20 family protein
LYNLDSLKLNKNKMFGKKKIKNKENKKNSKIPVEKLEPKDKFLEEKKNWIEEDVEEGELLVDVYQSDNNIIIRSTIAGVRSEDIDIDINNDMITIRGKRTEEVVAPEEDYFYKECYWGGFSRSIILPCEVQASKVKASLKNGVLTVTLPKILNKKAVKVSVDVK